MRAILLLAILLVLSSSPVLAESAPAIPKQLDEQITRLTALVTDGSSVEDSEGRMVQCFPAPSDHLCLVVFRMTVVMANGWWQQLAVFGAGEDYEGAPYYRFLDTLPLAGKGTGMVEHLQAKIVAGKRGESLITIPVMRNTEKDAMNFPSRPGT